MSESSQTKYIYSFVLVAWL